MTLDQAKALIASAGSERLPEATAMLQRGASVLEVRSFLEQEFTSEHCLAILDCLTTRLHFSHKFWRAGEWLLSREPAEQASDSRIARWRSNLLKGVELTELGCGIGGDTVFLSHHSPVVAWERCPARAELARYNLARLGAPGSRIENREVACGDLKGDTLFVDPARRERTRISNPQDWQPPLGEVVGLFTSGRFRKVAVKCAPGLNVLPECPWDLTFLSIDGGLKEAFLVLSSDGSGRKQAVLFPKGCEQPVVYSPLGLEQIEVMAPSTGHFLHNPDPAILRAGALDQLAQTTSSGIVHPKIGYLVGPNPIENGAADSFEIVDVSTLNWKNLKRRLTTLSWSEYEYLGRGVPFSQAEVRAKLGNLKRKKARKAVRGSVIVYREDDGYKVVLGLRYESPKQDKPRPDIV